MAPLDPLSGWQTPVNEQLDKPSEVGLQMKFVADKMRWKGQRKEVIEVLQTDQASKKKQGKAKQTNEMAINAVGDIVQGTWHCVGIKKSQRDEGNRQEMHSRFTNGNGRAWCNVYF